MISGCERWSRGALGTLELLLPCMPRVNDSHLLPQAGCINCALKVEVVSCISPLLFSR